LAAKESVGDPRIRVVSVLARELFLAAGEAKMRSLLGTDARRIVVEAGIAMGWEGVADRIISLERFGESGKGPEVGAHLGVDASAIVKALT
jgi:transketolase